MRKYMPLAALALLAVLVLSFGFGLLPPAVHAAGPYRITLLHTSENHGHWDPVTVSNVEQGGIARRATLVKQIRKEVPNTLLLDSGDISQGTLYFVQYKSQEGRDLYNMLGYDAVTTGNHEYDLGPQVLADNFVKGANFAIVLANVDFSGEPALAGKIPPYVIKEVGGEKIGLFGLVTDDLPINSNAGKNIKMKDAVQTAKDMVAELTKQGVNKIVLLSHRGYPADLALAGKVDGIDVILSGHTETLMGDATKLDPSLGAPVAPYPISVNTPNGGRTILAHDYIWGRLLGRLDLTFDDKGEVTNWGGAPIFVDKNVAADDAVASKVADLVKPLTELKKQIIGKTSVDLDGERATVRNKESNLGNLIADAMLAATVTDKTQVAVTNGGGIRTSIKAGDVSYGQVLEVLPFGNRLVDMDITGVDLRAALENGLSALDPGGDSGGRFPQIAGVKFSADLSQAAGARVMDVQVGNAKDGFKPLDPKATYRIVTNDFMATGGDGYKTFTTGKNLYGGDVPLDQALTDYIKAVGSVAPKLEGRITLSGQLGKPAVQTTATVTATTAATVTVAATSTVTATRAATATIAATTTAAPVMTVTPAVAAPSTTAAPTRAPITPTPSPVTLPSTGGDGTFSDTLVLGIFGALLLVLAGMRLRVKQERE